MTNVYYFIDKFDRNEILELNKKIAIIYRNYSEKNIEPTIKKVNDLCKFQKRKFFISNNLKIALKYKLDGLYLPSFNRLMKYKNLNLKKNFKLIGSAHSCPEIKVKEKQGCNEIFISPLFYNPKNKSYLDIIRFNNLSLNTNKKIIALGGINSKNLKKLRLTKALGYAGITWIKKNRPKI